MVTLQRYLYDPWDSPASGQESRLQCWVDLALHLFRSVREHVLGSTGDLDLRESLESIQPILALESPPADILDAALQFSAILNVNDHQKAEFSGHVSTIAACVVDVGEANATVWAGTG